MWVDMYMYMNICQPPYLYSSIAFNRYKTSPYHLNTTLPYNNLRVYICKGMYVHKCRNSYTSPPTPSIPLTLPNVKTHITTYYPLHPYNSRYSRNKFCYSIKPPTSPPTYLRLLTKDNPTHNNCILTNFATLISQSQLSFATI